ncbi:hypothetical protein ACQ1ZK_22275, partial [Enterococcus faecium]
LQVQPSQAAYLSSLARDAPYRQLATLFFITWCVPLPVARAPPARLVCPSHLSALADLGSRIFGIIVYFIFATLSFYLI